MKFTRALAQLWQRPAFRRLALVRVFTQAGDATLQLGMASYILFSPQRQPNAFAIAMMFTVTLLPFSFIAPFVSVMLDKIPRRKLGIVVDSIRAVVCLAVAVLIFVAPATHPVTMTAFFVLLLVAMSLNRFLLAGLSAALPRTVAADEMLAANTVMPVVSPVGAALAGLALLVRLTWTGWLDKSSTSGDAMVFLIATAFFITSVIVMSGFGAHDLGPDEDHPATTVHDVFSGMTAALAHLRERPAAGTCLWMIGWQRIGHGVAQVATLLVFRNFLDQGSEVRAMADIGLWIAFTAAGFFIATFLAPGIFSQWGLRRGLVICLLVTAFCQVWPGAWFAHWPLIWSGFLLGLCAQILKIGVDTVVQSHVDDHVKGRVFTLYDIIFNLANVLAGWIAVLIVPDTGKSLSVFIAVAVSYALIAAGFFLRTATINDIESGTESLR